MNLNAEDAFLQAIYFAQQDKKYAAYKIFKNLRSLSGSNIAPNVWLWLAKLSPDYREAQNALLKATELAPAHPHLSVAQAHFERRWRRRKNLAAAGLITTLSLLPFWLFTIYNLIFYPLFSVVQPIFYSHPFIDNNVSTAVLILFSLLIFGGIFLYCTTKTRQRVTFWNFLSSNFLYSGIGMLLAFAYFVLPLLIAYSSEYTYIGKITSTTGQQVFHLELENARFRHSTSFVITYKVYKCDSSGLFCQQLKQLPSPPNKEQYAHHALNKNSYRIQFDEISQELYIFNDDYYGDTKDNLWGIIKL